LGGIARDLEASSSCLALAVRFGWFELEFGDGMQGMGVEDGVYVTGCSGGHRSTWNEEKLEGTDHRSQVGRHVEVFLGFQSHSSPSFAFG
jgi:hypothetical protein